MADKNSLDINATQISADNKTAVMPTLDALTPPLDTANEDQEGKVSLEDQINNTLNNFEDLISAGTLNIDDIDALFNLVNFLPPSESTTREIARRLFVMFELVTALDVAVQNAYQERFAQFLGENPMLGFMLSSMYLMGQFSEPEPAAPTSPDDVDVNLFQQRKFVSPVNFGVLMRSFLSNIADNAVPLAQSELAIVADTMFDLLTSDLTTNADDLRVIMNAYDNIYFAEVQFAEVSTPEQRLNKFQSLYKRIKDLNNPELTNQFIDFLRKEYPLEYKEMFEVNSELVATLEILKDDGSDPDDRRLALIKLSTEFFTKDSFESADRVFFTEFLQVSIRVFNDVNYLDEDSLVDGSFNRTLLKTIMQIKSRLQSTDSINELFGETLFLNQIDSKIGQTFEMMDGRIVHNTAIEAFYDTFLTVKNYKLLGADLRKRMLDGLFTGSLASRSIMRLLVKLDELTYKIDGDTVVSNLNSQNIGLAEAKDHKDLLEDTITGEYVLFIINMDQDRLVSFVDSLAEEEILTEIIDFICEVRPEIEIAVEDKAIQKRTEMVDAVTKPIVDVTQAIEDAQNLDESQLKTEAVAKREQARGAFRRDSQSVWVVGGAIRQRWLNSIDSQVTVDAKKTKEQRILEAYTQGLDLLGTIFIGSRNDLQSLNAFLSALANPETKAKFEMLINQILECQIPGLQDRIKGLLRRMSQNDSLVAVLPSSVLSKVSVVWMDNVAQYNQDLEGQEYKTQLDKLEKSTTEGIRYKLAPLRQYSSKVKEENSLNNLYKNIDKPRVVVLNDMIGIFTNPNLFRAFIQNPEFTNLVQELFRTVVQPGREKLSGHETAMLMCFFNLSKNVELWNMMPSELKRSPIDLLVSNALSGSVDSWKILNIYIKDNQNPPPVYQQDSVADYLVGSYYYALQNNGTLRSLADTYRRDAVLIESASTKKRSARNLFTRGLTADEKRVEAMGEDQKRAVEEFLKFTNYFDEFAARPGARAVIVRIERENKEMLTAGQNLETELTLLNTTLGELSQIQLPDNTQMFLAGDQNLRQSFENYLKVSNQFVSKNKLLNRPPFVLDSMSAQDTENLATLLENLMKAYYYQIYVKGNTDNKNSAQVKLGNFISEMLFALYENGYIELYERLSKQLDDVSTELSEKVKTKLDGTTQNVDGLSKPEVLKVNVGVTKDQLVRFNTIANLQNIYSYSEILQHLIGLNESFDLDEEDLKKVLEELVKDKSVNISAVLENLYYLMFVYKRNQTVVNTIQGLLEKITRNMPKAKIKPDEIITAGKDRIKQRQDTSSRKRATIITPDFETVLNKAADNIRSAA